MRIFSAVIGSLLFQSVSYAELRWDNKEVEVDSKVGDTQARADFKFINAGPRPVTFDSVRSGCDCTIVEVEKPSYQAGERGKVTAVFTFGPRVGLQKTQISIMIQDESKPTILTMVTHIPELMKISPQFLLWQASDDPQPKTIALSVAANISLRVTRVSSTDPELRATLVTAEDGKAYTLVVTPGQTMHAANAVLTIETLLPDGQFRLFHAFARIKPAEKTGKAPVSR